MPAAGADGPQAEYGRFPEHIERDWLGRWCHLSEADLSLARRRTGDTTRLGFAVQLATVRASSVSDSSSSMSASSQYSRTQPDSNAFWIQMPRKAWSRAR